ncbi:hypothetical protein B0J18DRAFT_438595 [Chaetomium sp. MPI-SDFR-AT-0129]|nr:hypothetical protein B0J18DRAFT_438595 [Chaetomium sp. MPI-SDFR-AT-0129]
MARLTPLLLASLSSFLPSTTAANTTDYPALVELDQVFPQNATYTPAPVFPIVFALQGLPAAWSSTYVQVTWVLFRGEELHEGQYENGTLTIDHANYADPYYLTAWSRRLNSTDAAGSYQLAWSLEYAQCLTASGAGAGDPAGGLMAQSRNGVVRFTLAASSDADKNAQAPDLLAVVDKCPVVNGAFSIKGSLARTGGSGPDLINQNRTDCAVIDRAEPKGNPCAAKLDEKTAKNITAELKASACAASPPAVTDGCDAAGGDQQNGNGNGTGNGNGGQGGNGNGDDSGAGILRWSSGVLMGCVVASVMQWYL